MFAKGHGFIVIRLLRPGTGTVTVAFEFEGAAADASDFLSLS